MEQIWEYFFFRFQDYPPGYGRDLYADPYLRGRYPPDPYLDRLDPLADPAYRARLAELDAKRYMQAKSIDYGHAGDKPALPARECYYHFYSSSYEILIVFV